MSIKKSVMKPLKYIDLFAGCGGLSLGLYEAGWSGLFAIEKDKFAFETLMYNLIQKHAHFSWVDWLEKKEHDIKSVLLNHKTDLENLKNTIALVTGGPPCQGFSMAGQRNEADTRNQLVYSYIDFIDLVRPKMLLLENVRGFTYSFNKKNKDVKPYSQMVWERLQALGYDVHGEVLDFSTFGVPQRRKRFIMVGIQKELNQSAKTFFELLEKEKKDFLKTSGLTIDNSVEAAISDLLQSNGSVPCPDSKNFNSAFLGTQQSDFQKWARQRTHEADIIPNSHRFAKHSKEITTLFSHLLVHAPRDKRLDGKNRAPFQLKRRGITVLDKSLCTPTLTSSPEDYLHYSEPRILTVREYARIQTFPDWFEFKGKYTTGGQQRKIEVPRYTQVGNAIPPLFGTLAGYVLKKIINGKVF
jgi:DNA (cytosine-5)-methyltransferase 1